MPHRTRSRRRAFTLVEVSLAMGIFVLLGTMILALVIGVNRSLVDSQNKGTIDRNFRTTTSALAGLVSCADFIYVFQHQTDKVGGSANPADPRQEDMLAGRNLTGDYLVTVYYANPGKMKPGGKEPDNTVSRIAGICRFPDPAYPGSPGPVYMFDSATNDWGVKFPVTLATIKGESPLAATPAKIAALLPKAEKIRSFSKLADAAFASNATEATPDVGIFLNSGGTGAIMMARIRSGSPGKYVSNGYTFSVSSRNLLPSDPSAP